MRIMGILREKCLAPIDGVTSATVRQFFMNRGAEAAVAPLVSASALCRNLNHAKIIGALPNEKMLGVQLIGKVATEFAEAARIVEKESCAQWIDINCGCPAKKAKESGCGAELLGHPGLARDIISNAKTAGLPVSVKMRILPSMEKTLHFVDACSDADFITVHGRTPEQGYSGKADWGAIGKIRAHAKIPVMGNGDLMNFADGKKKMMEGLCDGYMLGRGALSNPDAFVSEHEPQFGEKIAALVQILSDGERNGDDAHTLKALCMHMISGGVGAGKLRESLNAENTVSGVRGRLEEWQAASQAKQ
jgi:tRNA-dihydrouridine synthase B